MQSTTDELSSEQRGQVSAFEPVSSSPPPGPLPCRVGLQAITIVASKMNRVRIARHTRPDRGRVASL
jgi:hypothetical protein